MIHRWQLRDFQQSQKKAVHVVVRFHLGLCLLPSIYSEMGILLPLVIINRTEQVAQRNNQIELVLLHCLCQLDYL